MVSGQKVWNTSAHHADFGLLLARTDFGAPKHRGITYFVLPMHQPGVEVRPLRQMNGYASFNEVFMEQARIPAGHVIGEVGGGWKAGLTTLAHERRLATRRPPAWPGPPTAWPCARQLPRPPRPTPRTSGIRSGPAAPTWSPNAPPRPGPPLTR